jgi:hypothetical protein
MPLDLFRDLSPSIAAAVCAAAAATHTNFALVGRERNGVIYGR